MPRMPVPIRWPPSAPTAGPMPRPKPSRFADPVPQKLVLYWRLRAPGAATAEEIAAFMQRNPDWPRRRRWSTAARKPLPPTPTTPPCWRNAARRRRLARALLRCAEATANAGRTAEPRRWPAAPGSMPSTMRRRGRVRPPLERHRDARRTVGALPAPGLEQRPGRGAADHPARPARHKAAEARLAVRRNDPQAEALVAALPPALQDDPG